MFRIFRATILFVCVLRVPFPQIDQYLLICPVINVAAVNFSGVFLLIAAFALVLRAHYDLGDIWRSGVDPSGPKSIITHRLYGLSRNPIFIGVMLAQLGFVLALPSVFSLVCFVCGFIAIRNQVRLEEKHLFEKGAEVYQEYFKRVPRWL